MQSESPSETTERQFGWRPKPWSKAAGVGRTTTFTLIRTRVIRAKKLGKATIIITPPDEYLASLPEACGPGEEEEEG